ncbi:MAG TPA: HD domain-containing protein [Candidatus Cloacimonadota bacterium]|nr:HD domain-containing protein [Candidatus Cloacimonadota bacterium]HPT72501.1 HD domain-containing protein [Candidatus Cloacimonadota bacterium]
MHKKTNLPDDRPKFDNPILETLSEITTLKALYRQGWIQQGVEKSICESVADHSFSTAMMAWIIALESFPELDADKVLKMAIVHELGEIYTGDITPQDQVSLEDKHQMEEESVCKVLDKLPHGSQLKALWEEFENGSTKEAEFVRQIDKLEMAFQAIHYQRNTQSDLQIFIDYTNNVIQDERLRDLFKRMVEKHRSI